MLKPPTLSFDLARKEISLGSEFNLSAQPSSRLPSPPRPPTTWLTQNDPVWAFLWECHHIDEQDHDYKGKLLESDFSLSRIDTRLNWIT